MSFYFLQIKDKTITWFCFNEWETNDAGTPWVRSIKRWVRFNKIKPVNFSQLVRGTPHHIITLFFFKTCIFFLNIHHWPLPITFLWYEYCVLSLFPVIVFVHLHVLQICISRMLTCWSWTLPSAPTLNMLAGCCLWLPPRNRGPFTLNWHKVRIRILFFPVWFLSSSMTWLWVHIQILISVSGAGGIAILIAFSWWY